MRPCSPGAVVFQPRDIDAELLKPGLLRCWMYPKIENIPTNEEDNYRKPCMDPKPRGHCFGMQPTFVSVCGDPFSRFRASQPQDRLVLGLYGVVEFESI